MHRTTLPCCGIEGPVEPAYHLMVVSLANQKQDVLHCKTLTRAGVAWHLVQAWSVTDMRIAATGFTDDGGTGKGDVLLFPTSHDPVQDVDGNDTHLMQRLHHGGKGRKRVPGRIKSVVP